MSDDEIGDLVRRDEVDAAVAPRESLPRDGFEIGVDSGPTGDRQFGDAQDALRVVPGRQVAQRVLAHQEDRVARGELLVQDLEHVGRVRRAGAVDVDGADLIGRRAGQREIEHGEPVAIAADDLAGLVRWTAGRNPDDARRGRAPARSSRAMWRWPLWTGSKVPPSTPMRRGWLASRHDAPADGFVRDVASGKTCAQPVDDLVVDPAARDRARP